jgi:hypothetical protein
MGADTSSVNIPPASCIITADLAPRRHPRNEVINPAAPGRISQFSRSNPDRENARFIPNPYCK